MADIKEFKGHLRDLMAAHDAAEEREESAHEAHHEVEDQERNLVRTKVLRQPSRSSYRR